MSLTRRRFAQSASLSLLASAAFPHALAQSQIKDIAKEDADPFRPENLVAFNGISMQAFVPLVGEKFTVTSGNRSLGSMLLLSVTDLLPAATPSSESNRNISNAPKPIAVGRAPRPSLQTMSTFALQFQCAGAAHPQGTYTISNASIGSLPLLLVPAGPGASANTCTAIFNLLKA